MITLARELTWPLEAELVDADFPRRSERCRIGDVAGRWGELERPSKTERYLNNSGSILVSCWRLRLTQAGRTTVTFLKSSLAGGYH